MFLLPNGTYFLDVPRTYCDHFWLETREHYINFVGAIRVLEACKVPRPICTIVFIMCNNNVNTTAVPIQH